MGKLEMKKVNIILYIIIIYLIISIALPFIFKYIIFESTNYSYLSNNEWAGFLGSYVGGILGGLGTLISVYITVKESRIMQADNKKDIDQKILDDKKEREIQRKIDEEAEAKKERREFAEDIAVYIGRYITYISKYYYASKYAENLDQKLKTKNDSLKKSEEELIKIDAEIEKVGCNSNRSRKLQLQREHILDKKLIAEKEYENARRSRESNSLEENRTIANECYFILKSKLNDIASAQKLISQLTVLHNDCVKNFDINDVWLMKNTNLLIDEYNNFKKVYEQKIMGETSYEKSSLN